MTLLQLAVLLLGIYLILLAVIPVSTTVTLIFGIVVVVLVLLETPLLAGVRNRV